MNRFCGNCFNESLNDQGICTLCGFNDRANWDKAPHGLPAGTILNGRYIIGKVLGQGGFGITYTAKDHQSGQIVAVKEFFPDSMATRAERTSVIPFSGDRGEGFVYGKECFLREAQTMAEFIGNPNIVRVYSYFEENETAYFVMEYVDGQSLQGYLKSKGGAIALEEALDILYPVMDALSAVHEKGIIHRDIAPDNIYISKDGTVKLLDFGAARYSLGNVSRSLDVILKHGFAPREQYKRRGRQGPYTDVYSMAATLYYAITGNRPDDALERQDEDDMPLPSSLGAKISPQQEDVLLKAMEVDYEKRFQTMAQFRNALKRAKPLQTETKKAPAEKPKAADVKQPEKKKPETVQKKKPLWLIPAAAALVCILIAVFAMGNKKETSLSVETTLPSVAEQTVPTVTPDPIPETVPLTDEEKAYNEAVDLFYQGEYGKAAIAFGKLGDFQDAREISFKIWDAIADRETISAGYNHTVGVKDDGTVVAVGSNNYGQCNVKDWTDIVAVSAGNDHTVGLKSDGTVVATGMGGSDWFSVDDWSDIVAIYAGRWLTIGLRSNGTLVSSATGQALSSLDCLNWEDIVSLGIGTYTNRCIGLKSDGAVICDNESIKWNNIIDISIDQTTAALCSDGTVYVMDPVPSPNSQKSNSVQNWTDIVKIDTGIDHILGLKSDGTVIASGDNKNKEGNVSNWTDIVAISAGGDYSVGLKADGTVVSKGQSYNGKRTASKWTNIKLPADRDALLSQIKPQHITPGGQAAVDITKNILMPVSDKVTDGESEFLNMSISRKQIRSITFLNTLKNVPQDAIDVSADGNGQVLAWSNYSDNRHDVFIAAEYGVIAPRNCAYLFYCMKNLQSIDFGNAFDTSNVTNMNHMFGQCHAVTSLDLSIFNTSKVTDMANMFDLCMNITELNVTSFDTSNVTNMAAMFAWCTDLKDLDLSHFDTSKVTTMNSMFDHCQNLKNLDLSGFDISNLADMKYMFLECPAKAPKWYRSK